MDRLYLRVNNQVLSFSIHHFKLIDLVKPFIYEGVFFFLSFITLKILVLGAKRNHNGCVWLVTNDRNGLSFIENGLIRTDLLADAQVLVGHEFRPMSLVLLAGPKGVHVAQNNGGHAHQHRDLAPTDPTLIAVSGSGSTGPDSRSVETPLERAQSETS